MNTNTKNIKKLLEELKMLKKANKILTKQNVELLEENNSKTNKIKELKEIPRSVDYSGEIIESLQGELNKKNDLIKELEEDKILLNNRLNTIFINNEKIDEELKHNIFLEKFYEDHKDLPTKYHIIKKGYNNKIDELKFIKDKLNRTYRYVLNDKNLYNKNIKKEEKKEIPFESFTV